MRGVADTREGRLVRSFVELADTLVSDFDPVDFLAMLAGRCVDALDVAEAGVLLADPDRTLHVMAASSEATRLLELFQLQNEEGPCLDCYLSGRTTVSEDLGAEERWPRFASEARASGFRSVVALPLRLRQEVIGALNLFRPEPGRLDDIDLRAGQALADVATIGLLQQRALRQAHLLADQLHGALTSRVVIEQAKGVLSERAGLDMTEAFDRLRVHARAHNRRLAEVAQAVIDGALSVDELGGQPVDDVDPAPS